MRRPILLFAAQVGMGLLGMGLVLGIGRLEQTAAAPRAKESRAKESRAKGPPIVTLAVSPDGKHLLAGSQAGIAVYSLADPLKPVRIARLESSLDNVLDLRFTPAASPREARAGSVILAVAGGTAGDSGIVELFDWAACLEAIRDAPADAALKLAPSDRGIFHADTVGHVAWLPDGDKPPSESRLLAAAGGDGTASLVRVSGTKFAADSLRRLEGHSRGVTAICVRSTSGAAGVSPLLVSAGLDHSVRTWDIAAGKPLRTLSHHADAVNDLAFFEPSAEISAGISKPLPLLASAGADRTVRFWQPTIGRMVRFARLEAEPLALAWLPEGSGLPGESSVVAGCDDGRLRRIVASSAEVVAEIRVNGEDAEDIWIGAVAVFGEKRPIIVTGDSHGDVRCFPQ